MQPLAGIRKATHGYAGDINDLGVIVGSQGYLSRGLPVLKAVLWSAPDSVVELDKQVRLGPSDTLEEAFRINNAGHILGSGYFPGITEANNVGFLLVPSR
jgi:hypothetical protein